MNIIRVRTSETVLSDFEFIDDCEMSENLTLIGRIKAKLHLVVREDGKGPFFVREEDVLVIREATDMDTIKYMQAMDHADMFADNEQELVTD